MTILTTHRLQGHPFVVHPAPGASSNPTPPALTGVTFSQPTPAAAAWIEGLVGKLVVATFAPVGGVGPFVFECLDQGTLALDTFGYTAISFSTLNYSRFAGTTDRGWIVVPSYNGKSPNRTLRITDATGAQVTKNVTIDLSLASKTIYISAQNRTVYTTQDPFNLGIAFECFNGSALDTSVAATLTDPSGYWGITGGTNVGLPLVGNFPPPGSYPLTLTAPGYPSAPYTVQVVHGTMGQVYFIQTANVVSTSMLPGTVVGRIACTTPNNAFTVSVSDASGTLAVDGSNVVIAKAPASPGSLNFTATAADTGLTATGSFSLSIVQGNVLPAGSMSFAQLTTTFTNDTWNNVIGTPTVTGVTGTARWSLVSQTGYNYVAVNNQYGASPARYQIDATTGAITAPAVLSAGLDGASAAVDTLVISCTDGINTCTASLPITVNWAPVTAATTFYIGRGMSTAHPGNGYEHFADFRRVYFSSDVRPHTGTFLVNIYADSDPDYFKNDNGVATNDQACRFSLSGPMIIQGVAANGAARPRLGGPVANNVAGGSDMRGKGFFTLGNGDIKLTNLEISVSHDAITDGTHGADGITKDGETYGNAIVSNCYIHDCDNGFKTGICHGTILLENNIVENCGTSYVSAGATHNIYVGEVTRAIVRNNVSRRANNGYLLKTRAAANEIYGNRFFDGLSGSSSANIDVPFAGNASIYSNVFEKGCNTLAPDTIRYGEEGYPWDVNVLDVHDNTISVVGPPGNHWGPPDVIGFFYGQSAAGIGGTCKLQSNSMFIANGDGLVTSYNNPPPNAVTISGNTTLALPALIDMGRPDGIAGSLPVSGPLYRKLSSDNYVNDEGVYQWQDREQIRVAHGSSSGTLLCVLRVTRQLGTLGAGATNPFGPGTTWSLVTDPQWDGATAPWATAGKYSVVANPDGSANLQVGSVGLVTGLDWLKIRATGTDGTRCDCRYPIVVT